MVSDWGRDRPFSQELSRSMLILAGARCSRRQSSWSSSTATVAVQPLASRWAFRRLTPQQRWIA
ncbi:hypothetical protein DZF91_13020 [Actinomadura logoneensis]|uniref:Uncharacterized protein n=1 Tax=Actinomadura logoneensis TaxID=2293572 RepID=A0A372JML9_9ACTN|nr:hypothetical protein DZF91_13020 [Actinomadura logoneensis]